MQNSGILPGLRIAGLGLFVESEKTLVVGDLQLGFEESLNAQGVFIPRVNLKKCVKRLNEIFSELKEIDRIAINGDLKHEFGRISEQEWREVVEVLQLMKRHAKEVIIVKGNHDIALGPIAGWENVKIVEQLFLEKEKILIVHGHRVPESKEFNEAKILIIGHEHPAIALHEGVKREKFKCFLKGKFREKTLIVIPSLTELTTGTDVLNEKLLSPFLEKGIEEFEAWVIEDKPYYFGKLKELL